MTQILELDLTQRRAAQTVHRNIRLEPWRDWPINLILEITRQQAAQVCVILARIDLELPAGQNPSDARLIELYRAKDPLAYPFWQADTPGRRAARLQSEGPQQPEIEPVQFQPTAIVARLERRARVPA